MKKRSTRFSMCFVVLIAALCLISSACFATVQSEILKSITLDDKPKDITLSRDGTTAYILCEKSILIFSLTEQKITDTIPLSGEYSQITLSPDDTTVLLASASSNQLTVMQVSQTFDLEVGKSPVIGKEKAPVTVTAFLDYQCPYCARVYPTLKQLLDKYPKDVKLVIKHYPLPMHQFAEKSSKAALAAAKQDADKYAKLSEILFSNYNKINDTTLAQYVQEAGLDMKKFDRDLNDSSVMEVINQDKQLGQKVKVRGVPAIFINGTAARGRTLEAFSQMVEQELKKKK